MDLETIKALMAQLEASKLKKLVYKQGDFELHLEKESDQPAPAPVYVPPPSSSQPVKFHFEPQHELPPMKTERTAEAAGTYVTSPMVGTYYGSPAPDQPPFVKVGDTVSENTIVCIIEAMKVMNEVKAGVNGVVAEILTDSAQPVEFGTRLLRITDTSGR
ncbi:MAG: acetyl-CoA carboxylase biotin carboxyl carrier protein [Chlamydiales bacterium]|nr:acetyl-CoA carboxylase biotin carboxyl carrier protein [Chlamydiales bacterium]